MGAEHEEKRQIETLDANLLKLSFKTFGRVTVSLPLVSLFVCFFSAIIFNFNEVNKTVCNVQNVIPSISAITGVTPQRYIWRISIALHSTPRFAVGLVYYNYYISRLIYIKKSQAGLYKLLLRLTFACYCIENACLVGVTYIANVENYPVHEKIFVVFMVMSLIYELMTIIIFRWAHPEMETNPRVLKSYRLKKALFIMIICCTAGLLYFFLRHRLYCETNAFTKFACCEYIIVMLNILYHYTVIWDMHGRSWIVGQFVPVELDRNGNRKKRL